MTTKLIDKVVNTEPSGLSFLPPSFKPRPELYPRHASKDANHPQPTLPRSLPRERMQASSAPPKGSQNELRRILLLRLYGKSSSAGEAPRHEADHGSVHQRFPARTQPLVVFAHPPLLIDPGDRALHHPPARE